jgi:hypothetical protein
VADLDENDEADLLGETNGADYAAEESHRKKVGKAR